MSSLEFGSVAKMEGVASKLASHQLSYYILSSSEDSQL